MADIFISYSKQDRDITEALAGFLESEGYIVWWDTSLVAGESFRTVIDQQLDAARAIIVIWSQNSVSSDWVIAEAEHGDRRKILIPLRTPDLEPSVIPKPYNTRQTDLAHDFTTVRAALKKLAVNRFIRKTSTA